MKDKWHVAVGLLFLAVLVFDLFAWGGLARSPVMGPIVSDATGRELALASVYVPLGRLAVDSIGVSTAASNYASEKFSGLQSALLANPQAAMETLVQDMPLSMRLAYYGAPLLLVVFALLWWRRPREIRTLRRR